MDARATASKKSFSLSQHPELIVLVLMAVLVAIVIASAGGDPLALAQIGTRFSQGDPNGTEGYDGQFVYYIARDPSPARVAPLLDVPAYRYQRILLPLLGRLLALGHLPALPWVLAILGILTQTAGTWVVSELLASWGIVRKYALIYGLWAGLVLAVRLDLSEPLAYGLAAAALLAYERRRTTLGAVLFGLALFAKETVILFVGAQILIDLLPGQERQPWPHWRSLIELGVLALLPFGVFQIWLWLVFSQFGVGSGGAMATPFEFIPFMGFLRMLNYNLTYAAAMLVVFGPFVILPTLWAVWQTVKKWLSGERNVLVLALLINSLAIVFLPFSTFREPGGLLRFATGLMLALLLFAARYRYIRILNYSMFWMVLNVFLLKN